MSSPELPSRAKPEALHELCRHLQESGPVKKTKLYDEMDIDRRQIRASIDYGAKLGFLKIDGDSIDLGDRGRVISYNESLEETAVKRVFREALEAFKPYRETLLRIHAEDLVEEIGGEPCIRQSTFKSCMAKSTGRDHTNREINLLIKTAQAAGLGEFITGRKGMETRLRASDRFEKFMQKLLNEYEIPEREQETKQPTSRTSGAGKVADDSKSVQTAMKVGPGELKLTVELDVNDKSDEEILQMVRQIQSLA